MSLTFGPNQLLTLATASDTVSPPPGSLLKYEVLDEVFPKQLYMVIESGDTLRRRHPLGIYKIDGRRLVICEVGITQQAIGGIPFGEPDYEWPSEFSGDCFGLDRK